MASCYFMVCVTIMLVTLSAVGADHVHNYTHDDQYISPSLSPYTEIICEEVECGKGRCEVEMGYPFNFKCECEDGWKRTRLPNEDAYQFLPCTIPICSLDYSCMPTSSPTLAMPYNVSVYDPCLWIYCGEGTCTWNKPYKHTCECRPGYNNALSISFYPCYSDCALGSDCERLGVARSSKLTSSHSNGGPRATPFVAGNLPWISILLISIFFCIMKIEDGMSIDYCCYCIL